MNLEVVILRLEMAVCSNCNFLWNLNIDGILIIIECSRRYPSTMVCKGTAVLLHVQKFWIISAESNNLLALAQRFERRDGAKLALDRRFGQPDGAKLALDQCSGCPSRAKLALEHIFGRPHGAKLGLERHFGRPQRLKTFKFFPQPKAPTRNLWIHLLKKY